MKSSAEQRARRIKAVVFDVDGVLTDGGVILGPDGEWKRFNVQDGHGFDLARRAGLKTALLTGRSSAAVRQRARELKSVLMEGVKDKDAAFKRMARRLGVSAGEVCYVGDDLVDLPAMKQSGLPVAVANAVPEVKASAAWVTSRRGGDGAAREVLEFVIKAKGLWKKVLRAV